MKKILYSILIITITIVLSSCSRLIQKEDDITKYGEFFGRAGSISEYLVFPKQIPESATNITYKSLWNDISLIDPTIQIYLEYELNEEDYAAEIQRISEARLEEGIYQVWEDKENFIYPAYVATDGYSNEYEYVLMDDENHRLIYVYLWHELRVNIKFNKKYLPDYFGKPRNDEEKRSIYWLEDLEESDFTT